MDTSILAGVGCGVDAAGDAVDVVDVAGGGVDGVVVCVPEA